MSATTAASVRTGARLASRGVPARPPRRSRRWGIGAVVMVAYLVPAVVAYWPVWSTHPTTTALTGAVGDPAQYEWLLGWVPWALAHGHNVLATRWVNWPFGIDVLANPSMIALGVIGAPITAAWGPIATLNVWFTLSFPLSAGAGYLLARRFTEWRLAAFAGGLLYGYCPYLVTEGAYHLNLAFVPIPPLVFLVLHDLVVRQARPAWRSGLALAFLLVLQFFISTEVLATTALFGAVAVVVVALRGWRQLPSHLAHAVAGLLVAAAAAGAVLAYPIHVLFSAPEHLTGPIYGYVRYHSSLVAPLLPTSAMRFGTPHLKAMGDLLGGNASENGTYLGAPLVLLAIVAGVLVRRRAARLAALLALVAFVLSLGERLTIGMVRFSSLDGRVTLPGSVLAHLPLLEDAFPERYTLYVALFVSVLLAVTLDAVHDRLRRAGPVAAGLAPAAVAAAVLVPLVPAWPYGGIGPAGTPPFFTTSAVDRLPAGGVTLVYPFPYDVAHVAQVWQAQAGYRFKMPGGYFVVDGPTGAAYDTTTPVKTALTALESGSPPARTAALRATLRAELGAWHVGSVVAQDAGPGRPIAFLTWLIGRPPDAAVGGVEVWDHTTWG